MNQEITFDIYKEWNSLLPCPFCGHKLIEIKQGGMIWTETGYTEPLSYTIIHHCKIPRFKNVIERTGKTLEEAINLWNTRV